MEKLLQGDKHHGLVRLMKHYRQQALTNMELHFQLAVRDQVISDQKMVLQNLWRVMDVSGVDTVNVMRTARDLGIAVEPPPPDVRSP